MKPIIMLPIAIIIILILWIECIIVFPPAIIISRFYEYDIMRLFNWCEKPLKKCGLIIMT